MRGAAQNIAFGYGGEGDHKNSLTITLKYDNIFLLAIHGDVLTQKIFFVDYDNTQMNTEELCRVPLAWTINERYGSLIKGGYTPEIDRMHFKGMARERLCREIEKHYNIETGQIDHNLVYERRLENLDLFLSELPDGLTMAPDVIENIVEIKNMGWTPVLATNSTLEHVKLTASYANNGRGEELLALFGDNKYSTTQVKNSKPAPDLFHFMMERFNVTSKNCLAVEDSKSGATAAIAADVDTLGYTQFACDRKVDEEMLKQQGCLYVFKDWQEAPEIIARIDQNRRLGLTG